MLKIQNLKVQIDDKQILNGLTLVVEDGQTHALMGQNGSGKSTLAQTLMGSPTYEVLSGTAKINSKNLFGMDPNERSKAGLFLSFQYPSEIPGVNIGSFLRMLYNNSHDKKLTPVKFRDFLKEKLELLEINPEFMNRYLNDGFSGGEKKRMELLQMLILEPNFVILDEIDSGLDIDALKLVAKVINYMKKQSPKMSFLIITHYQRILDYITPDRVHVMKQGEIIKSGDKDLAKELEKEGYARL